MAGIIARITRSNRERLEKKKCEISVTKCIYQIQPFDDHFDPEVSNIFVHTRWIENLRNKYTFRNIIVM